eukprot:NODE_643_length_1736_cov_104.649472_g633_i0.p1 GENE.NODE_643_length_1736_cov_104.649472_g633_i0~~NODE_643_length_1736_cov_104.649472_g633_i0.p1  ORF type:complete len:528 (+),score=157.77 NODE_643_length_1736_cov_104.649472_g633_i0:94-1677(+)
MIVDSTIVEKGQMASLSVIVGAIATGDRVKSTLGPKGRDKILMSHGHRDSMMVTNDGATILKNMETTNPSSKLLVDVSKTQDDEVGDGTTSVCVLTAELLRNAEPLLNQGVHPQTIIQGFLAANKIAQDALSASAVDNSASAELFDKDLFNIARTTLSSKIVKVDHDHFAKLAVDAIKRLKGSGDLEHIHIIKKLGGSFRDSFLAEGFLLDKKFGVGQPKRVEKPKILVANTSLDTDRIKIYGARVRVEGISELAEMEKAERKKMKAKCEKILAHKADCFINRQLIYDFPDEIFAEAGMMAIQHADFDGIERLSMVLGAEITSTFDSPETVQYGYCDLIDSIMVGEDQMIRFSGCKRTEACTIVLRGPSEHILDEAERSLHDALCVLKAAIANTKTVLGAGCSEMLMAKEVDQSAKTTPGKKALGMAAFATALRTLPKIIAENAGLDATDLATQLEAEHYNGNTEAGLDIEAEKVSSARELGITESFAVKSSVVAYAADAAIQLLRVDNVVTCAPRKRKDPHGRRGM